MDKVLILAREEVVAALLGLLVELRGYLPVYAKRGESLEAARIRTGCKKVVIDCDHWDSTAKNLIALKEAHVKVVLFSPSRIPSELEGAVGTYQFTSFTLPIGPEAFGQLLED